MTTKSGGCLCGAVRFEVDGPLMSAHICHCGQCRRQSGHCVASGNALKQNFRLISDKELSWYTSSPGVARGFCGACGSALFWDNGSPEISVNLGSVDMPSGERVGYHIFVADKADYYEISDDLPKFDSFKET